MSQALFSILEEEKVNFNCKRVSDSSFVPPLLYAVLGSSRHVAVGPTSSASLVMGMMLSEMVSYIHEPILHLKLAFTATFFAGIFQASLGFFRYNNNLHSRLLVISSLRMFEKSSILMLSKAFC